MALRDRLDDRQAQAAAGSAAARVHLHEPLEDRVDPVRGNAGARVPQCDEHAARSRLCGTRPRPATDRGDPQPDPRTVLAEVHCVRRQLHDGLDEAVAVGHDDALRIGFEDPVPVPQVFDAGEDAGSQLREVDGCGVDEIGAARLGQRRQVAHQFVHALDLFERDLPALRHVVRVGEVGRLHRAADDRERCPQFMAHVAHEAALLDEPLTDPVEHRVEGPGQGGDVVVAVRNGHTHVEVVGRDRLRRLAQLAQWTHEAPAHQVPGDRGDDEQRERGAGVDPRGPPDRVPLDGDPVRDDEDPFAVVPRDGHGRDRRTMDLAVDGEVHEHGAAGDVGGADLFEDVLLGQGVGDVLRLEARRTVHQGDHGFVLPRCHGPRGGVQELFEPQGRLLHRLLSDECEFVDLLAELQVDAVLQRFELGRVGDGAGRHESGGHEGEHHRQHAAAHRATSGQNGRHHARRRAVPADRPSSRGRLCTRGRPPSRGRSCTRGRPPSPGHSVLQDRQSALARLSGLPSGGAASVPHRRRAVRASRLPAVIRHAHQHRRSTVERQLRNTQELR